MAYYVRLGRHTIHLGAMLEKLLEYSERPEDLPGPAMLYNSGWRKAPSVRGRIDAASQMNHHRRQGIERTYTYPYN